MTVVDKAARHRTFKTGLQTGNWRARQNFPWRALVRPSDAVLSRMFRHAGKMIESIRILGSMARPGAKCRERTSRACATRFDVKRFILMRFVLMRVIGPIAVSGRPW